MLEADEAETRNEIVSFNASVWKVFEAAAISIRSKYARAMRSPARSATKR